MDTIVIRQFIEIFPDTNPFPKSSKKKINSLISDPQAGLTPEGCATRYDKDAAIIIN